MIYFIFLLGFVFLFLGGKYLVEGSVSFAKSVGLSPLIIAIVLIGFGTSVPELVVCIQAALKNSSDIAVGNIIGSNICNVLLVLASGAIIYPIAIKRNKGLFADIAILVSSSVLLTIFCFMEYLNVYTGIISLLMLFSYIFYKYRTDSIEEDDEDINIIKSKWISLLVCILGIAGVLIGAEMLVESAIHIAREYGVSEKLIALTAIALGTSLPELATILMASLKKHSDIALGNVIGSNIFNILGILGTTSIVRNINISRSILYLDIWVMNLAVLLMITMSLYKNSIGRKKGIFLLSLYVLYIIVIYFRG